MDAFDYLDLNDYVRDFFEESRKRNSGFSLRSFSVALGYRNPSFVNDVISGRRKASVDLVDRLASRYRLSRQQSEYLAHLAAYQRAKGFIERDRLISRMRALVKQRRWRLFDTRYYDFMVNGQVLTVYALIALKDYAAGKLRLAQRLRKRISPEEFRRALRILDSLGYVARKDGRYEVSLPGSVLAGGDQEITSQATMRHHLNVMETIREIYPRTASGERDVRSTTMAVRAGDVPAIKELIRECHQAIMKYGVDSEGDDVYVFATQLIPLTHPAPSAE